jgi:peptide/nickel transport system substrate-binding protein
MNQKLMTLFGGVLFLAMILLTDYQPASAAPPTGEVKSVSPNYGNMVPIPFLEVGNSNDWIFLLYDFMLGRTPQGQLSTETGVANKWEKSPDALDWTFYIRKGIKFHDGVELTAKDFKFTIEQLMTPASVSDLSSSLRKDVKSIELKDPYTVVIHLKQPNIFLPNILRDGGPTGAVIPKDYFEKVGKDEFARHPIGSGPYKFHSVRVGDFIKLEATDKHWRDGVPRYKYMTFQVIPEESTQIAMLRTGEADIASISRDGVKEVLKAGLNVLTRENCQVLVFQPGMQWASPIFSDIRFRKALNLAINREAIIKHLFVGLARPMAAYPGSYMAVVGADMTLKPYPYDFKEAKRLIKEGGWEGHEFTLINYSRPGCPEFPQVVEAIAGYWQEIGLKPKIRNTEWPIFRIAWREQKVQNTVFGFDDFPAPDAAALVYKLAERWWYGQGAFALFNKTEVNERFDRIEKSMDVAEVSKPLSEIYRIVYDQYLAIPICEFSQKIATTKRIPKWNMGSRQNDRNYNDLIKQ